MTPKSPVESTGGMRSVSTPTPSAFPQSESMRPTLVGARYMISAGHPLVACVCAEVLERGGTAIDAGVAGGLASNVIQPDMCNLGGIAPIVLRQAGSSQIWAIDGVGCWGREVTLKRFLARFAGDMPLGPGVGIVPGAAGAWITALQRFGTWSFTDVVKPAIAYCMNGWRLDPRTCSAIAILGRNFSRWESSRSIYWPLGRAPKPYELLRQEDLGRTLQAMADAEQGATREQALDQVRACFYEGEIASRLVDFVRAQDGWLTCEDLRDYRSDVHLAPEVQYGDYRVATTGTYSQGPVMLEALGVLNMMEGHGWGDLRHGDALAADRLHLVAEALKAGFHDRERFYADPGYCRTQIGELLTTEHLRGLARQIRMDRVQPALPASLPARPRSDTTYLCVVDAQGNAFSAMPSDTLDGNPIVPGLGFFCSPRGVQSRLQPEDPNVLAPGKRPRITPAPAIALEAGASADVARVLAFGCPGGDVIVQSMLQAFLYLNDHGMTMQQAVEAPRICTFSFKGSFFPNPSFPNRLHVEARFPASVRDDLASRGHDILVWPDYEFDAGSVSMAGDLSEPDQHGRTLGAAADFRRSSYAWGC